MRAFLKELSTLNFPAGVVLGTLLSILTAVLKKQIEEHASTLLAHFPGLITKSVGFRLWEKRYRTVITGEHRYVRFVGLRQQLELAPPKLEDVYIDLELQSPSSQTRSEHLQPALTLRDTFQISVILNQFKRAIILGGPGAGKTTILEHLVAIYGRSKQHGPHLLPIYVHPRRS